MRFDILYAENHKRTAHVVAGFLMRHRVCDRCFLHQVENSVLGIARHVTKYEDVSSLLALFQFLYPHLNGRGVTGSFFLRTGPFVDLIGLNQRAYQSQVADMVRRAIVLYRFLQWIQTVPVPVVESANAHSNGGPYAGFWGSDRAVVHLNLVCCRSLCNKDDGERVSQWVVDHFCLPWRHSTGTEPKSAVAPDSLHLPEGGFLTVFDVKDLETIRRMWQARLSTNRHRFAKVAEHMLKQRGTGPYGMHRLILRQPLTHFWNPAAAQSPSSKRPDQSVASSHFGVPGPSREQPFQVNRNIFGAGGSSGNCIEKDFHTRSSVLANQILTLAGFEPCGQVIQQISTPVDPTGTTWEAEGLWSFAAISKKVKKFFPNSKRVR